MDLARKDLFFAHQMGREFGVPLELGGLTEQIFARARSMYGGGAQSPMVVKMLEEAVARFCARPASRPSSSPNRWGESRENVARRPPGGRMFSEPVDSSNIRPNTAGPKSPCVPAAKETGVTDITDFAMDFFPRGGNAIVTGGNTGLGQAFTLALAKAGASVFVPSIVDDDGSTGELVKAEGGRYEFLKTDVTAPGAPAEIVAACVDRLGSLDILVNSAGICPLAGVLDFGREQWDATVAVNLTAAFEMAYEAAKVLIPRRAGKIDRYLLAVLVPRRPLVARVHGHQARLGRLHQGLRGRACPVPRPGQRNRAGSRDGDTPRRAATP